MRPNEIRELRDALQMTQEEFAARLGLETRGAVSRLETGSREPTGPLLRLLLDIRAETERKLSRK